MILTVSIWLKLHAWCSAVSPDPSCMFGFMRFWSKSCRLNRFWITLVPARWSAHRNMNKVHPVLSFIFNKNGCSWSQISCIPFQFFCQMYVDSWALNWLTWETVVSSAKLSTTILSVGRKKALVNTLQIDVELEVFARDDDRAYIEAERYSDIVKGCFCKTIEGRAWMPIYRNFRRHSFYQWLYAPYDSGTATLCATCPELHSTQSRGAYGRAGGFIVFHKYIANDESYAVFTLNLKGAAYRHKHDRCVSLLGCYASFDGNDSLLIWIIETPTQLPWIMERI